MKKKLTRIESQESLRTLLIGSAMAVLLCAVLVFFSPIQAVTSEIASRTRPNLFDLFVALFSALAGAYAMIKGKEGAIVGVAIATALMRCNTRTSSVIKRNATRQTVVSP